MNKFKLLAASAATGALVLSSSANAALSEAVTTQTTNMSADMTELGGIIIGLAALAMSFKWLKAQFFG